MRKHDDVLQSKQLAILFQRRWLMHECIESGSSNLPGFQSDHQSLLVNLRTLISPLRQRSQERNRRTNPPRAVLISTALFFIAANSFVESIWEVEGRRGQLREMMSLLARRYSRETRVWGIGGRPEAHEAVQLRGDEVGE